MHVWTMLPLEYCWRSMFAQKLSLRTNFPESGIVMGFLERLILSENFTDLCLEKGELCWHVLGSIFGDPWCFQEILHGSAPVGMPGFKVCEEEPPGDRSPSPSHCAYISILLLWTIYYIIKILLLSLLGKKNTISKCFGNHSYRFSQIWNIIWGS